MKNKLSKILILISILLISGMLFFPIETRAACSLNPLIPFNISDCVAGLGSILTSLFGTFIFFSGALLNQSIRITLNIKELYESTRAIDQVWLIIRNLSNIGIIFILLFASISTILDVGKTNIKELVVKIIMAGLLINFSLFFTKVAIDTSNLVSLQFYRAIAPEYDIKKGSALTDGGISDIFMNSLKIQTIYDPKNSGLKGVSDGTKIMASIIIGTYGGIVLMIFATLSFFAAAIAFSIRTGMLLLLMAFSPIYFVGMIFPKVKSEISDKWLKYLTNQLLFMPIYLLLMYVALRFISDKSFLSFLSSKDGVTSGPAIYKQIGVAIQYFIAILFINAPLVAAISFGAMGTKFVGGLIEGVKDKVMGTPSALWRNSGGLIASKVAESNVVKNAASRNFLAAGALKGMRGVAKSYNETNEKQAKTRAEFGESLGYDKKSVANLDSSIRNMKNSIVQQDLIINNKSSTKSQVDAAKDQKRTYQLAIRKAESRASEIKRERQISYAQRIDPRDIDPATGEMKPISLLDRVKKGKLRGYISKDEEMGSAKIHVKNLEAEIEQLKKELDDKKKEQDTIKADIKKLDERELRVGMGRLAPDEEDKRKKLKDDLFTLLDGGFDKKGEKVAGLVEITQNINDKEFEVKKYKNLT